MTSNALPPSYYGTTTVIPEKPAQSTAYHITLQRCKRLVELESGRSATCGLLEDTNVAIVLSHTDTWDEVQDKIWLLYQKAWPAILGDKERKDYASGGLDVQYSALDGTVMGRIQLLYSKGDAFWDLVHNGDIKIVRFIAHYAPLVGEAAGEVRCSHDHFRGLTFTEKKKNKDYVKELVKEIKIEKKAQRKHHCIIQ
ncbi:hypothetical protein AUEXF2481DRAFT_418487 [Aureobasidium subglaciale EXF-2481]|uniref:Uncharacterized protein n=1 Tax=Aureobasidium subglaciale (strain EXF-2481) TaxID=1043005 RepID=A0A074Y9X3_AURSE|nr:uncharacterized protein AUEXF2481DRAFT_418487 [Aureobasidium subglaciale EXF-2481]KAI5197663.1 hypothetical protein E4T38_07912 [Aureobasidium subglaciale]KAI5216556.1 hypothetical protein E4T40_07922 [Aureobasidium subglaciale]KAI5219770.1 hypothetical protein E4T41_07837 [Aureobasidium subglaciale]KAI5257728.1 hypothetical protein E4T46_07813 [Aureobasidium subglaciale]KEQ92779.1 hypothetical protein AUEXF2481DRAFT_418487 [Aureobasidium subglaciale EXF-2481]